MSFAQKDIQSQVRSVRISLKEELARRDELQKLEQELYQEANALQERAKNIRTHARRIRKLINDYTLIINDRVENQPR